MLSILEIAAIVDGSERLANEIGRAGVTDRTLMRMEFREALSKRMAELRCIEPVPDSRFADYDRRKREVYGRLSALLTLYTNAAREYGRPE